MVFFLFFVRVVSLGYPEVVGTSLFCHYCRTAVTAFTMEL